MSIFFCGPDKGKIAVRSMLSRLGKFAFFVPREGNWDVLEHNLLIKGIFRSRASITIISLAFETSFAPKFHRSNGSRSRSSRITNKLINSFKLSSILAFSSEEVCFVEFLSCSVFISIFEKSSSAV